MHVAELTYRVGLVPVASPAAPGKQDGAASLHPHLCAVGGVWKCRCKSGVILMESPGGEREIPRGGKLRARCHEVNAAGHLRRSKGPPGRAERGAGQEASHLGQTLCTKGAEAPAHHV